MNVLDMNRAHAQKALNATAASGKLHDGGGAKWKQSSAADSSPFKCEYENFGCEFIGQSEADLKNHLSRPECQASHLNYTAERIVQNTTDISAIDERLKQVEAKVEKNKLATINKIDNMSANETQTTSKNSILKNSDTVMANLENFPSELVKFVQKTPLWNMKNMQFLYQVQTSSVELQEQLNVEKKRNDRLENEIKDLRIQMSKLTTNPSIARVQMISTINQSSSIPMLSDSGYGDKHSTDATMSDASEISNDQLRALTTRIDALEKTCEELKSDKERCKQLERFVMHLHERIKSLDCGRTGVFIWKITGFDAIFENAKKQHELKISGQTPPATDTNSACDFCSPLFYTGPNGYLMYMRLYPFGCDSAASNFVSLFVALSPGEYDGVLTWPFLNSIEISMLSQEDPADKWTQVITPGGNNLTCFQRPSSKSGNMSVGILHFIIHNKIYGKDSVYKKNDTIYIEVKIRDNDSSYNGPQRAKQPRLGTTH